MSEKQNKVKYHIPEQGNILYISGTSEGKTEMIVLGKMDREQVLPSSHYQALTKNLEGKIVSTGKKIDFAENLTLSARQSLVIEF